MARAKASYRQKANGTGANVGYEAELWRMADALRGSMDAAEYKHVVPSLVLMPIQVQAAGRKQPQRWAPAVIWNAATVA